LTTATGEHDRQPVPGEHARRADARRADARVLRLASHLAHDEAELGAGEVGEPLGQVVHELGGRLLRVRLGATGVSYRTHRVLPP
jgi:hypothetical protein